MGNLIKANVVGGELFHPNGNLITWTPLGGGKGGGNIYDWTQTTEDFPMGSLLEFTCDDDVYRVFMHRAWPVQIAGPRLKELHTFTDLGALPTEWLPLVGDAYRALLETPGNNPAE